VQLEPALLDSVLDAAPKSASLPLRDIKKRRVDLLNMNAVVLDGLSARGELNQLTRRCLRICKSTFDRESSHLRHRSSMG
jgi:hypothetical protein